MADPARRHAELVSEIHRLSPANDAFARVRVSDPVTLFDSTMQYDLQANSWETVVTGTGSVTHRPLLAAAEMAVGTASGDRVVRQTHRYVRYQPGKSHLLLATGTLGEPKAGVRRRIGLFDAGNGVFFQSTTAGWAVVVRSSTSGSPVDTVISQADWNMDPLDGSGPSGIVLDPAKANIFLVDLEWLGVGRVRFGAVVDGGIYYCHEVLNANNLTTVYMSTATLPIRYELENTAGTASATTLFQICSTVVSEGGNADTSGSNFAAGNGIDLIIGVTTRRPILSIRPGATFNGVLNRVRMLPNGLDLNVTSVQDRTVYWEVVRNGTLTATAWTPVGGGSVGEFNVDGSAISGGQVVWAGYDKPTSGGGATDLSALTNTDVGLSLNHDGTVPDILTVVCTASGTTNIGAVLKWFEAK